MKLLKTPKDFHAALPRDYWHVREPMGQNFSAGRLGGYYIDMREKVKSYPKQMRDGIPLRNQNGGGLQLLPVTITQMALGHYENWLIDKDDDRLQRFMKCADWLVEHHGACPGKMDGWSYFFNHERLGIKAPFISAMGQGQGISVLCRAHHVTGDEKYLSVAKSALDPFFADVSDGGVTARLSNGGIYYEEYPCQPFSHILNGHIFALWGLYDYAVYMKDQSVEQMFWEGANTLKEFLPRYDIGFWSRYGLYPHPYTNVASPFYHELHIAQLAAMHALTGIEEFRAFSQRWDQQFENWWYFFQAVYGKLSFKLWVIARKRNLSRVPFINPSILQDGLPIRPSR